MQYTALGQTGLIVLRGASKLSRQEDNPGAAEVKLSPQEVEKLDKPTAPSSAYLNWFQAATLDTAVRDGLGDRDK